MIQLFAAVKCPASNSWIIPFLLMQHWVS